MKTVLSPASLQHCLFCSNGGMSLGEKENLVQHFISNPQQRLFHMSCFPTKQEVFEFISMTATMSAAAAAAAANVGGGGGQGRKRRKTNEGDMRLMAKQDPEDVVLNEDERTTPNRVIVFDDLMTEAFTNRDNEATMNLITTKLSHHNNTSILIVYHELYPKGKNSVLFRDQLMRVHLHTIANQQRIHRYIYRFLSDDAEKCQFDHLFNEHVLRINDSLKGNRRGSIFIRFTPGLCMDSFGVRRRIGRFLTFNESGFSVVHETFDH